MFSMIFDLTRQFVYDPAEGNLLVEFRVGPASGEEVFFDATPPLTISDSVSRAFEIIPVTHTRTDSIGLVTRFFYENVEE